MQQKFAFSTLRVLLTAVLAVLTSFTASSSESLSFRNIPSKLLHTNAVRVLFSDSEGYIWIPTYSGLVRYDGSSTVVFGVQGVDNRVFDCHINVVCE